MAERKVEAPKAPRSSAVGARTEAPKAPRGVRCGEGFPLPTGGGVFFFDLELKMASFGAFWVAF